MRPLRQEPCVLSTKVETRLLPFALHEMCSSDPRLPRTSATPPSGTTREIVCCCTDTAVSIQRVREKDNGRCARRVPSESSHKVDRSLTLPRDCTEHPTMTSQGTEWDELPSPEFGDQLSSTRMCSGRSVGAARWRIFSRGPMPALEECLCGRPLRNFMRKHGLELGPWPNVRESKKDDHVSCQACV